MTKILGAIVKSGVLESCVDEVFEEIGAAGRGKAR